MGSTPLRLGASHNTPVAKTIVIKESALALAMVTAGVFAFWLWRVQAIPAIAAGDFHGWARFAAPVAGLALASVLFAFGAMFIRDRRIAYGAGIIGVAVPYFFSNASTAVLLLMAASVVGIAFAVHKIRREFSLSIGFSVSKIAKSGLSLYFTAACVIISVFYADTLSREHALAALLPKPAFDMTLNYFLNSRLAQSVTGLPEVRRDITADELLDMLTKSQLEKQGIPASQISPADLARLRAAERREIERQYGVAFRGDEKAADLFYGAIARRADELLGPWRAYAPFISALTFFFALKTLTLPLYLISLAALFLLIKGLLSVNILQREVHSIEVERITL